MSENYINDNYENGRKCTSKSFNVHANKDGCFKETETNDLSTVATFFINGIMTDDKRSIELGALISFLLGGDIVRSTHNSSGGILVDLSESFYAIPTFLRRISTGPIITTPALELISRIKDFFRKSPFGALILVGHSQGCLHVKHALIEINEIFRKRMFILQVLPAPGAYISPDLCLKVIHITVNSDPIGCAALLLHTKNVQKLKSINRSDCIDHHLDSNTFRAPIKRILQEFKNLAKELTMNEMKNWDIKYDQSGSIDIEEKVRPAYDLCRNYILNSQINNEPKISLITEKINDFPISLLKDLSESIDKYTTKLFKDITDASKSLKFEVKKHVKLHKFCMRFKKCAMMKFFANKLTNSSQNEAIKLANEKMEKNYRISLSVINKIINKKIIFKLERKCEEYEIENDKMMKRLDNIENSIKEIRKEAFSNKLSHAINWFVGKD